MFLQNISNSQAQAQDKVKTQFNINKWKGILDSPEGQEYKNGCTEGLKMRDADGDGKTTSQEMGLDNHHLTGVIFKDADTTTRIQATLLTDQQNSIFDKYAGDDGVLDEYEYAAAINSDEYGAILEKYNKLQESVNGDFEVEDDPIAETGVDTEADSDSSSDT